MPDDYTSPQPYPTPVPSPPPAVQPALGGYPPAPGGYGAAPPPLDSRPPAPTGPVGQVRRTGVCMLLCLVTLGIYALYYYFVTHDEIRRHGGWGVGGPIALVVALFAGLVSPFLLSYEVGGLYERTGRTPPVTVATGLWYFPGMLILVGPFIWFVRTNRALNAYWQGLGAR
jgi:Domain of unknown function (DUF4234)